MCDWRNELYPSQELFQELAKDLDHKDFDNKENSSDNVTPSRTRLREIIENDQESNSEVNSLLALRDFMLHETLSVVKLA